MEVGYAQVVRTITFRDEIDVIDAINIRQKMTLTGSLSI